MGDFLDADCVFAALISGGVFTMKVWKNTMGDKSYYHVMFDLASSARRAGFVIYVVEGCHQIGRTALINIARQFQISLGDILTRCAVAP
ncbi:MAG: hypothetical protein LBC52_03720 [Treponema sp.]|jgi:hypothetical protein|nr:hypothetical protein [Treponema sp.]